MSQANLINISLEREILEHPRALHLRRMRSAFWLYLAILGRMSGGIQSVDLDPREVAASMGLPEGTIRSWLGHLRKQGYFQVDRLNGHLRVTRTSQPTSPEQAGSPELGPARFFTVTKLARALGDTGDPDALQATVNHYSDQVLREALARALAVPEHQVRRSRTALFLYFLKQHAHER